MQGIIQVSVTNPNHLSFLHCCLYPLATPNYPLCFVLLKFKDFDLDSILQNANGFEEALSALENALQGEDLEIAESALAEAIMNAQIYGALNG